MERLLREDVLCLDAPVSAVCVMLKLVKENKYEDFSRKDFRVSVRNNPFNMAMRYLVKRGLVSESNKNGLFTVTQKGQEALSVVASENFFNGCSLDDAVEGFLDNNSMVSSLSVRQILPLTHSSLDLGISLYFRDELEEAGQVLKDYYLSNDLVRESPFGINVKSNFLFGLLQQSVSLA